MTVQAIVPSNQAREERDLLEVLYQAHYRRLLGLAAVMLRDRSAAEEAVQDAFVRVLRRGIAQRSDPILLGGYLRTVLINVVRTRLRRQQVARRFKWDVSGAVPSAEEQAVLNEEQRGLTEALRQLPLRQRECLALRYYMDLSDREIAETLRISPSSVKTHMRRGLAALTKQVEVAP